jgi:hypothetical protein
LGNCWAIADSNIQRFYYALCNDPKAHPKVCREMIDKWLDYRAAHGPTDEAWL